LPIFSVGFKYEFSFNWRDKNVLKVAAMMVPRTLSLAVSQVNFFIMTAFASAMAAGSLAVFNLSNNLQGFPLGVFGVSLGVAALPVLSSLAAEKKMKDFVAAFSDSFRQILFFIIPISALLYVLRAQIVRVILGHGNFNWYDTRLTAACLAIFCLGLFAQSAYPLVIRSFYALHNTRIPLYVGAATIIVHLLSLFIFDRAFAASNLFSYYFLAILHLEDLWQVIDLRVLALPLAITISSIFELVALMFFLRLKIGKLDGRRILDSVLRILFASLGAGLLAYFMLYELSVLVPTEKVWGIFSQGLLAGLVGLSGYWLLGWLLKMEEMSIFVSSMKKKLFKSAIVMAEDNIGRSDNG